MTDSETRVPDGENAEATQPPPEPESVPPMQEEPRSEEAVATPPVPEYEVVPAKQADPRNEEAAATPPVPEYEVVQSKREQPESGFVAEQYRPVAVGGPAARQNGPIQSLGPQARLSGASIERIEKFASSQTRVYAATGVGLGLLVGLVVAAIFLRPGSPSLASDMGAVNSNEYGLKGRLATDWKDRLAYHLTIEPSAPELRAGFQSDVSASPRPLSIDVQVKDPFGKVLCGNTVLLKFDPRNAPTSLVTDPGPKATKAQKELAARNEIEQGLNLARLEGQELDREHGRDVFQADVGPDGKIASISNQGTLPCTRKQFDNIASWSFTTDFPILVKPAEDQGSLPDANAEPSTPQESSAKNPDADKASSTAKTRRKPLAAGSRISVEGDDAIVWFDASNGIIETSAGKVLLLDKTDTIGNSIKGRDFPIQIHYRCDQTGACTFAGVGTGVHHARARK